MLVAAGLGLGAHSLGQASAVPPACVTLAAPGASPESIREQLGSMLRGHDPGERTCLEFMLDTRPAPEHAHLAALRGGLLESVGEIAVAPAWLSGPLARVARDRGAGGVQREERLAAVVALGSVRSREAAAALIDIAADPETATDLRAAAFPALARLSGRDDIPATLDAWQGWLASVKWLPEAEWRRVLAEGLAEKADRAERERSFASDRLVDVLREQFFDATAGAERSRLIERALADRVSAVRRAGLSLALQELANARQLDERVAAAAVRLLADSDRETTRQAAELLSVLSPGEVSREVHQRLDEERRPEVAALLLRYSAQWPSADARASALRWLDVPGPAREAALDVIEALLNRKLLRSPDAERVLAALRAVDVDTLGPAGLRLLYALGTASERARLVQELSDQDPARRLGVAEALAREPSALSDLLGVARSDPAIASLTVRALAKHRPTAESFSVALTLPIASEREKRDLLLELSRQLRPAALLRVARQTADLTLREALLARLTSEPLSRSAHFELSLTERLSTQRPAILAGLLLLAQTRLELGQPAAALQALDAAQPIIGSSPMPDAQSLRVTALVWLARIDDALAIDAPIDAWMDGLAKSADLPHADSVLYALRQRFAGDSALANDPAVAALAERARRSFIGPQPGSASSR
jgi:hypothetical protein